ncbi:MAG: hypothetical protein JXM74_09295 [Fusobacteriaceae bacterium]|nr:hypothetical protein [Fusobacteriaceae bacterium]
MKYFLMILLSFFIVSCTSFDKKETFVNLIDIEPKFIKTSNFEENFFVFTITNNSETAVTISSQFKLLVNIDNKEYQVQKKSDFTFSPNLNFGFSFSSKKRQYNNSLGLIIESSNSFTNFENNEYKLQPQESLLIRLELETDKLYYKMSNKKIPLTDEILYGYFEFYGNNLFIFRVPVEFQYEKYE